MVQRRNEKIGFLWLIIMGMEFLSRFAIQDVDGRSWTCRRKPVSQAQKSAYN